MNRLEQCFSTFLLCDPIYLFLIYVNLKCLQYITIKNQIDWSYTYFKDIIVIAVFLRTRKNVLIS